MKNFLLGLIAAVPVFSYAGDISIVNYTGQTVSYIASFHPNFKDSIEVVVKNCIYASASRCDGHGVFDSRGKRIYIRFSNLAKYDLQSKIYGIDPGQQLKFGVNGSPRKVLGIDLFELDE